MTGKMFFAYLLDVFIIEKHQGKRYSNLLIAEILNFTELKLIDKWMSATKDAQNSYKKFELTAIKSPDKLIKKLSPVPN